jgi:hypothetical protein
MMQKIHNIDFSQTVLLATGIALYWLLPLSDPDYFWHLKTGELIFSSGALPTADPFSFTMHGERWVLHEWGVQLLLYISHNLFTDHGIRLFMLCFMGLTLYFTYTTMLAAGHHRASTALLMIWLLLSLIPFITPRPQLASYLFFSYYLYAINATLTRSNARTLLPLPFAMLLWVNMHGGYIIGIALLALSTAVAWIKERSSGYDWKQQHLSRKLLIITVATLMASALNPDFFSHWKYPFYVLSMEATTQIDEWQGPNLNAPYARSFLALVCVYTFMLVFSKTRPATERLLIPPFFIIAALISARNIPFAFFAIMAFLPRVSEINTDSFRFVTSVWCTVKRRYIALTASGKDIGQKEYVFNWFILVLVTIVVANLKLSPVHDTYPHKAVDFFIEQGLEGNILSEYKNGGYLIYRLYPSSRVFIDGRADMYGDKVVAEHTSIMQGNAQWKRLFEKYNVEYIICNNKTPIHQQIVKSDDFELLYSDNTYSVFMNSQPTPHG